jgi:hypothetical protein
VANERSDRGTAAKRKATNVNRNCKRTRRRAVKATFSDCNQSQRALQVVVGAGICSQAQLGVVPWEHRGMLGNTRGGGGGEEESTRLGRGYMRSSCMHKSNAADIRTTNNDSQEEAMRVHGMSKWNLETKYDGRRSTISPIAAGTDIERRTRCSRCGGCREKTALQK